MRATAFGVRRAKKRKTGQVRGSVLNPKNENSSGRPQGEFGLLEAEFGLLLRQAEDGPGPGGPGGPATGTTGGAGVATRSEEPGSDRFRSRDEDDEEPGRPRRCSRRVVDPQHPGKAVWDVGISIMIVYSVLVEPFRIGFGVEVSGAMLAIDIFVDCLFVIDIVLTFFTAYLDEREVLVTNRLRIAQRYLRGFFVIDVASVFPAELFLLAIQPDIATQARAVKLLRLVRLMKLGRLFKLKRLVLLVEEKLNFSLQVMDMLKMLVKVLFIVHWLACLTFLVASPVCADGTAMPCPPPESPNDDTRFWSNWVRMFQVDKFDLAARYLSTFHFITATLMAVGYGDIFPANSFERIVCIVSQITGAVLFGFLLSCITAVLEFTHPRELEHKKRMSEIKNWLRNRSLPQPLKTQVWSHFCYVTAQRSAFKDEHTMLLSLPTHLRSQLVESSQKTYFQAIQASLGNFEKGLVAELAVQVMPMQVPYHMCILETGELTTELYVVVTGRVEAVLVEERHNENPEQLEAFLKLCLASSDPRRNGGGVAREDLFDEPSGNSLPDASADGEEARPRAERTRRRQATPTRGLIQRARSFLTEGVGLAAPAPSEDIIQILCGIYGELEAFGHCAVAPLRFRGGCYQSEIFSISQDILDRAMSAYPGRQQEFEVQCRSATKELARAMLSAEWSGQLPQCAQPTQRLKGLVVYRTKATDVRQLPADVLEEADEAGFAQASEAVRCVSSKRLDKGGKVVTEVEPVQDIIRRWVIPHNDSRKIIWDLWIGGLIIYSVIAITFSVSFHTTPVSFFIVVDVIVDVFFGVDMILSCRTAFVDSNGLVNTVPYDIYRHYLKGQFLVDFLSTVPIDRIVEAFLADASNYGRMLKLTRFARIFRLMKLARMLKLFRLVQSAESSVQVSPLFLRLGLLFMNVCFLAHVVACMWHWLATLPLDPQGCVSGRLECFGDDSIEDGSATWLQGSGGSQNTDTNAKKYVAALYWVFTTMTTVGYGDIFPMNNIERVFAVGVMIFGATVFGYIVGSVAEMATHGRQNPAAQSLLMMRQYCEEHGFHQKVVNSVRRHVEFWYQEMSPFDAEPEILHKLPAPLRREVILHIHRHVIGGGIALFALSMPAWLQALLVRLLEPQAFAPGELIVPPTEAGSSSDLIFVYEGSCEAILNATGRPLTQAPSARRRGRKKEVRGVYLGDSYLVLETYPAGTMLGFEALLGEEALQSFGCPRDCAVRCSATGTCSVFAMKVAALVDAHRSTPHLGGMLTELMTCVIVTEGRRRVKERQRCEEGRSYETTLEAYRAAKAAQTLRAAAAATESSPEAHEAFRLTPQARNRGPRLQPPGMDRVPEPTEDLPRLPTPGGGDSATTWDPGGQDRAESGGGEPKGPFASLHTPQHDPPEGDPTDGMDKSGKEPEVTRGPRRDSEASATSLR